MPQLYDPEDLAKHAAAAWCMSDFISRLGVESTRKRRSHLYRRLKALGIDTGHWDRSPKQLYSDELLADAVRQSTSMAGVLRLLGVPNTGGQHSHLSRRVKRAGIDTSHFLGQAHSRGTPGRRLPPEQVLVVRPAGSPRPDRQVLFNALKTLGVPYVCGSCGCGPEWRGQPLTLHIDHINGDYLDNRLENLRFLCPNCHAQTSSWCRQPSARPTE
jgi:hypothetical protein